MTLIFMFIDLIFKWEIVKLFMLALVLMYYNEPGKILSELRDVFI
jgi:hypothetical protein